MLVLAGRIVKTVQYSNLDYLSGRGKIRLIPIQFEKKVIGTSVRYMSVTSVLSVTCVCEVSQV